MAAVLKARRNSAPQPRQPCGASTPAVPSSATLAALHQHRVLTTPQLTDLAFGSRNTAEHRLTILHQLGMVDRFRSLPMARSAVLAGRTLSDTARNLFVVTLMLVVGTLVGFRFHAGVVPAIGAVALALAFGLAFSWISALIGLSVRDVESAQAAGFVWVFPLVFASSAFVPVASMPGWLQAFVRVNPVTITVNALRALTLGGPTARPLLQALAWIVGILLVFVPLAVNRYRRAAG